MSDCKKTTNESQTSKGKWILRRIVVAAGMSSVGPLEERRWELIDGSTGIVRRTYKGVEYDGRYCMRCDGPVSVEFSDDQEWLIVQEDLGGHYKERLPDIGSDEERALA